MKSMEDDLKPVNRETILWNGGVKLGNSCEKLGNGGIKPGKGDGKL